MSAALRAASAHSSWFFVQISLFWVGLSFLSGAANIQILPKIVPDMVGVEWQGTAIGAILAVGLVVAIVVQPLAGALSDRAQFRVGRRRPFIVVGILIVIPFLLVIGLTPYYWVLFLAAVGVQIGANIAQGPYQGVIPDQVQPASRGRASGFFGLANLLGTMLGVFAAGELLVRGHVFGALLVTAIVLAAAVTLTWVFVREAPPPSPEPFRNVWHELRRRIRELRGKSAFAWLLASRLLFFMGVRAMDNFLQLFIGQGLGEDDPESKTTIVLAAVLVMAVIASLPAGRGADRFGRLRIVAGGAALGCVSAVLLVFAQDFTQLVIFAAILGIGLGMFAASDWAAAIDLIPDVRAAGLYMGLTNVATAGGDAIATMTAGATIDLVNRVAPGVGFRTVFAFMAFYFLLSVIVLIKVRARAHAASPDSHVLEPDAATPGRESTGA